MLPGFHPDAAIGQVLDQRYRIIRTLGRGGMGAVYEAEHTGLSRRCAIKLLLPEHLDRAGTTERFRREAIIAARIRHPHVVDVFDTATTSDGVGYIVMELLEGETLERTLLRDGSLPFVRARGMILQICDALASAHARGIVHRDMKPANCFRVARQHDPDFIKLLDFGIAKLTQTDPGDRLTDSNAVLGTYAYMACEQISGEDCDARADVWAVAVMLYEMVTGVLPFSGRNPAQIWMAVMHNTPLPIEAHSNATVCPPELDVVLARALAKNRDERYASITAFADALAALAPRVETSSVALPDQTPPPMASPFVAAIDPMAETVLPSPASAVELPPETVAEPSAPALGVTRMVEAPIRRRLRLAGGALLAGSTLAWIALSYALSGPTPEPVVVPSPRIQASAPPADPPVPAHQAEAPLASTISPPSPSPPVVPPQVAEASPAPSRPDKTPSRRTSPVPPKARISFEQKVRDALPRVTGDAAIRSCFSRYGASERVKITFTVSAATGKVMDATASSLYQGSPIGKCLLAALFATTMPRGAEGDANARLTHEFTGK